MQSSSKITDRIISYTFSLTFWMMVLKNRPYRQISDRQIRDWATENQKNVHAVAARGTLGSGGGNILEDLYDLVKTARQGLK